ncbi:FISUMP domain-containing protein [Parabacteroides sp. PF5-9]|uniref:FISUMP domain-containing protein n=1 Tax=Parabacteroides sp. PF5-9 TaxID=1742404 RepID=UPI002473F7CF|nr:FISUMP domain-containing protein [Parabacteroides sp. PF5-9]MDH6356997.1 uncharacterized protein (TIGR02145 family) [Parabacteroides sp. PF5-9]
MKTKVFFITLLLSLFSINSGYAQLGNALKKAKEKAKEVVKDTTKETVLPESKTEQAQEKATTPDADSRQKASSGNKLKPSAAAIAADPKASDETIESGFTRSHSEIRAHYEQLSDKVYYKPYYADECNYFYALGEEQQQVFQTELSYVEQTYQAARKFAHIKIIQPINYRNYVKVKIPAYRENPAREGYAVIGQHAVYAYFAQFAADPEGFYPYLNFVSARVAHTALSFFKVAEWMNRNGEQCECAITLEDGSKAQLVESFQGWKLKMNDEFFRLNKILNEQTPFNTIGKAAVGVLQQMKKAESDSNLPILRMYFHRYETIIDDLMNHPQKVEEESYFMLVREYNAYKEKYEGWAATTKSANNYNPTSAQTQSNSNSNETKAAVDDKEGVVINGIKWAISNIAAPGTFAAKPEDAGLMYQWNRKKGWHATTPKNFEGDWINKEQTGKVWEKANDPSPEGWRIPTLAEMQKLLDETKVTQEWITVNGVPGKKYTDKASGKSIFLPAAGSRHQGNGNLNKLAGDNASGAYWSSEATVQRNAHCLTFAKTFSKADNYSAANGNYGYCLRCVKK